LRGKTVRQNNNGKDTPMTAKPHGQVMGKASSAAQMTTGFAGGTTVLTLDGAIPVEFLNTGDRIITRDGARILRAISMVVVDGDVVRVGASTLGHDRPRDDVMVSADQGILVRDCRAKAMYGVAQAMIPAARMADGEMIRREAVAGLRLFTLSFDAPAVIYAGGLELACAGVTVAA
jgi:hypothetical protein